MPEFQLNLEVDGDDLRFINGAQEKVILAKPVNPDDENTITWQSFAPFENNAVSWEERYGLYCSTKRINNGAVIFQSSQSEFPAQDGRLYVLDDSRDFGPATADPRVTPGTFAAENQLDSPPSMTMGLFQAATVNGEAVEDRPVNAQTVNRNRLALFTPRTTVVIWLQAHLASRTIVTHVITDRVEVTFGGGVTEQTLKYNADSGLFEPKDGKSLPHVNVVRNKIL